MSNSMMDFLRDERGLVAIEYSLIAALASVAIIWALTTLEINLQTLFQVTADAVMAVAS